MWKQLDIKLVQNDKSTYRKLVGLKGRKAPTECGTHGPTRLSNQKIRIYQAPIIAELKGSNY